MWSVVQFEYYLCKYSRNPNSRGYLYPTIMDGHTYPLLIAKYERTRFYNFSFNMKSCMIKQRNVFSQKWILLFIIGIAFVKDTRAPD